MSGHEERAWAAVDLGAGSGRVIVGRFGANALELDEVHRFDNRVLEIDGHEHWDVDALFGEIVFGLREAGRRHEGLVSVGVDTWGVDYGLLDEAGRLLGAPFCYRDRRTEHACEEVFATIARAEIYARTGIQIMPINTLFQLHAHRAGGGWPEEARTVLMMPDLFHWLLSGERVNEITIASTSQILSATSGEWDPTLLDHLGLPRDRFPRLVPPGTPLGPLRPSLAAEIGVADLQVVTPAGHDTACAVAAAPLGPDEAYISSGTWSLVGVELDAPQLGAEAAALNFTNERGIDGTIRFLKNVMGLWIAERCREEWARAGQALSWDELLAPNRDLPPSDALLLPNDLRFLNPTDMLAEVRGFLTDTGQSAPEAPSALIKVILDSLALSYAETIEEIRGVTGREIRALRVMGGGSRNEVLDQAAADACGIPVHAGPVEATAIGNVLIQAIRDGRFPDHAAGRRWLHDVLEVRTFEARPSPPWTAARERYRKLSAMPR